MAPIRTSRLATPTGNYPPRFYVASELNELRKQDLLQLVIRQRESWPHTDDSGNPLRLSYKSTTRKELIEALLDQNNLFSTCAEAPEGDIPVYLNSANADDAQSVSSEGLLIPSDSPLNSTSVAPYVRAGSSGRATLGFQAVTVDVEDRSRDNVLLSTSDWELPLAGGQWKHGVRVACFAPQDVFQALGNVLLQPPFDFTLLSTVGISMDDIVGPNLEMGIHHLYSGMIRDLFRTRSGEDGISTFAVGTIKVNLTNGLKLYIEPVGALPLPSVVPAALALPTPPNTGSTRPPLPDWAIIRNHILSSQYALDYQAILHTKHKVLDSDEDIVANWRSIAHLIEFYSTDGIDGRRFRQSQIALAINVGMQSVRVAKKGLQLWDRYCADESDYEFTWDWRDHGKPGKQNLLRDLQAFDAMKQENTYKRKTSRKGKGKAKRN